MAEADGFIGRWSRRKIAARRGAPEPEPRRQGSAAPVLPEDAAAAPAPPDRPPAAAEESEAQILARLSLPDIDSLTYESDFTVFMRAEVPERIRRRALRKLWRSNPVLANLDGLNDYEDDYSDAALAVDGLKTLYRVGRGLLDAAEPAQDAAAQGEAAAAAGEAAPADADPPHPDDADPAATPRPT